MIVARLVILATMAAALSACAGEVRRDVVIGPPRNLEVAVPASASVQLSLPPGDTIIEGVSEGGLKADMQIRCASATGGCADRAAEVQWKVTSSDTKLELAVSPHSMLAYRDAETTTHVWVPLDHAVSVSMSAGDLEIRNLSGCLDVAMSAGDVSVEVPAASVKTAHLDANFGDASLAMPGNSIEGHRRLLVGAEVNWQDGAGSCALSVDLGAGEIQARLY